MTVAVFGTEAESCMRQRQDGQQVETSVPVRQLQSKLLLPGHWSGHWSSIREGSPGSQRLGTVGWALKEEQPPPPRHGLRSEVCLGWVGTRAGTGVGVG